jgi:hypothetical protein
VCVALGEDELGQRNSGSGRAVDQPDTTRLGELLCG